MSSEIRTLQLEVSKALRLPTAVADILRKRQFLKKELLKQNKPGPDADCNSGWFHHRRS